MEDFITKQTPERATNETSYTLTGNTNDLLMLDNKEGFKGFRLVGFNPDNDETVTLEMTSVSEHDMRHDIIDRFIGKNVEITIKVID